MSKTVVLLNIFMVTLIFFRIISSKNKFEIIYNSISVCTVTFDWRNVSLVNKSVNLFKIHITDKLFELHCMTNILLKNSLASKPVKKHLSRATLSSFGQNSLLLEVSLWTFLYWASWKLNSDGSGNISMNITYPLACACFRFKAGRIRYLNVRCTIWCFSTL